VKWLQYKVGKTSNGQSIGFFGVRGYWSKNGHQILDFEKNDSPNFVFDFSYNNIGNT
jgi:hypothetical protein